MKRILSVIMTIFLVLTLFCGINVSAENINSQKTTNATFSYCRGESWNNFKGKILFSDYADCIRIQTDPQKDYYLSYKTWNEDRNGYYAPVKSNVNYSYEYAGNSGKRIRNLSITVCDRKGNYINEGIVVMYRAFVGGVWLPWVSNAGEEWMKYVQRKYKLDGVLDTKSGNAGINTDYISGLEIYIYEEKTIDDTIGDIGKSKLIEAPIIGQLPNYPTGCESVSAVMALQYNGFNISADTFIDTYLDKGDVTNFDPNVCFGGDPKKSSGMGCYAPVIKEAVNNVLESTRKTAKSIENYSLEELCKEYIDNNVPVIVWATMEMNKAYTGVKIACGDKTIQWIAPEHCLLLVGYDENNYIFNDPRKPDGAVYYSKNQSENAYCALGCQAIAITNKPLPDESFALSDTSYIYNGAVRTPNVTVRDIEGTLLKKGIHYDVDYDSGRKNVGTYKVTITMKGNYSGSKILKFKINPIDMSKCTVKLSYTSTIYNGNIKSPVVTVKNANGTTLKKDTHYTVKYASGRKNVGTYNVTVTMKGNYSGSKILKFEINPIKASECTAKLSYTATTYNGKTKSPVVTVKNHKGTVLKKDTHYTVKYDLGRKYVGKYKVTVTLMGNYTGTKTLYFYIAKNLSAPSKVTTSLYGHDDVSVSWSKVSGATAYKVYYKLGSGSYKLKTTTKSISYKFANLSDGAKYTFKIVPCTTVNGGYYADDSYKTSSTYTLKKVSTPIVSKYSSGKVKVSWTNIAGESGYQISKSNSKSKTGTITTYKTTSGKSKVISAAKGKTYYYKVRAYKVVNDKKIYGAWSSVKAYKLPFLIISS